MKKTSKTTSTNHYSQATITTLAAHLASQLKPGDIVTLDGPLGSGKTTLTQALCQAYGVTEPVTSPSFGLINEYVTGQHPIAHIDLYRLGPEKAYQLWDELNLYLEEATHIIMIEWACYAENFPINLYEEATVEIHLNYVNNNSDTRDITLKAAFPITLP